MIKQRSEHITRGAGDEGVAGVWERDFISLALTARAGSLYVARMGAEIMRPTTTTLGASETLPAR